MHTCNITKHQEHLKYEQICVQPSFCANHSFIWKNNPCHLPPGWGLCLGARIHNPSSNELSEHRHISLLKSDIVSQPHFEGSVRSPFKFPKMRLESPPGLPKIQNSIAGVKTPRIEVFLIPLESSWSVDVQNGLAWAISTCVTQVIGEKRAESQIVNLTPDH